MGDLTDKPSPESDQPLGTVCSGDIEPVPKLTSPTGDSIIFHLPPGDSPTKWVSDGVRYALTAGLDSPSIPKELNAEIVELSYKQLEMWKKTILESLPQKWVACEFNKIATDPEQYGINTTTFKGEVVRMDEDGNIHIRKDGKEITPKDKK